MENFDFKPFKGKGTKATNYFISITKANALGLSADFCKKNNVIDKYNFALLLWDSNRRALAIKLLDEKSKIKGSFAITKGKTSASIMAHSFFKDNKIDPKEFSDQYEVHEFEDPNFGLIYYILVDDSKKLQ